MNRNVESYFSTVPTIDIQRSSFDMSQDIKFSFDVGELIPFYVLECLPGDTMKVETSKVCRLQTLLTPVMDNIYLDTYFFFVPYRLCWTHWKNFMGENTASAWLPEVTYTIPQTYAYHFAPAEEGADPDPAYVHPGDYLDYMGIPVQIPASPGTASTVDGALLAGEYLSWSSLPERAAALIWNEWFRDENLKDPYNVNLGDGSSRCYKDSERPVGYRNNLKVAKFHDYFTSALPAPVKGEPVLAPIESSNVIGMPVGAFNTEHTYGKSLLAVVPNGVSSYTYVNNVSQVTNTGGTTVRVPTVTTNPGTTNYGSNLYGNVSSLGINIMSLRNAFQVQKLLERDARSGTRYTEIIKGHFSVQSPDSRLQRPEYLGGNRIPISIHQITNQSQGEQDFLGDLGAMSLTTDRNSDFTYSCTEHGVIIGMVCARYDHSYPQGLEKFWSRKTRFDFYWPEFAHLSEQAILNKEIYAQGIASTDNEVFGYQEAYADYRYKPNRVAGEMRPGISNTLASWHFADYYESLPHLSSSWINENKSNVDRTLAVTSEVANQVFCDVYVDCIATRPMPVRSIPGLSDHF